MLDDLCDLHFSSLKKAENEGKNFILWIWEIVNPLDGFFAAFFVFMKNSELFCMILSKRIKFQGLIT